jgi:YD repeat-containing protein
MVAIVTGNGLGLFNTSLNVLGGAGALGQGWLGQARGRAYVNAASGNLILQSLDQQLSGRGADLNLLRSYNSLGQASGQALEGWRWDGERRVQLVSGTLNQAGSIIKRIGGDGAETLFTWNGSRYVSKDGNGAHDTLEYNASAPASQRWTWTDGSTRQVEQYETTAESNTWRLKSRIDTSGNPINFSYDSAGRLTEVLDFASGQKTVLVYSGTPARLAQIDTYELAVDAVTGKVLNPAVVSATPVKQVEYSYYNGRLDTVRTILNPGSPTPTYFSTSYSYLSLTSPLITGITQSDGFNVSFTYKADGSNRIETVTDANGKQTFNYFDDHTDVVISAADGSNPQTWTYTYDTDKQLVKIESPAPTAGAARLATTFTYESASDGEGHQGNLKSVTQTMADGHVRTVSYDYDARGNCIGERDALGNTVTRTYSDANQLLSETHYKGTDPDGAGPQLPGDPLITHYVYDAQARLRFVVSADARLTENRYNSNGLLQQVIHYRASRYGVGSFTESDITAWVNNFIDRSQTDITQLEYDFRGNLSKRTDYATANSSGNGVLDQAATVTEYVYDGYGQLLHTIAVRGSGRDQRTDVSTITYDGMGRELTRSDANGLRTTSYDDAHRKIQVSTGAGANQLVEISSFDSVGRLTSVSRAGSGSTRETKFIYDAQGRLALTIDPLNGRQFSFYDAAGRLSYEVDAGGAVTAYTYNAAGQLLTETRHANRIVNTDAWLDSTTNPTQVTRTTLADVITTSALDRTTRFDYDDAGRLYTTTDAANIVTTTSYDGDSRITQQRTGDRITRYIYDADGRQVGVVDALGYLTESRYNAAGRLIETVRYATVSAAIANPPTVATLAAWRPAAADADLHSYRYYDGQGRLVGSVNEQGYLTEFVYDAQANLQRTVRYRTFVTVADNDSLSDLKGRAGASETGTIEYDALGRVSRSIGVDGSITRNEYDELGRLARQIVAEGANSRANRIRYNAFGEVNGTVGGVGDAWLAGDSTRTLDTAIATYGIRYEYDKNGRQTGAISANGVDDKGNIARLYYDADGRLTHSLNAKGEVSETQYDAFGEVISTRGYSARLDVSGALFKGLMDGSKGVAELLPQLTAMADATRDRETFYEYDQRGLATKITDPRGVQTTSTYTAYGQLATQIRTILKASASTAAVTTTSALDYDLLGQLIAQTSDVGGLNFKTQTKYDAFGRVSQSIDGAGQITQTFFKDDGRAIEVTDPLNRTTRNEYDAFARVLKVIDASGNSTQYAYDDVQRTLTMTTPEGVQVVTHKNEHGETVLVTQGSRQTSYAYDKDGHLTLVADSLGNQTTSEYDLAGRLKRTTDARGVVTQFSYDEASRMFKRQVDPTGLNLTTTYEFDSFGQQIKVGEGQGGNALRVTVYQYFQDGRLAKITVDPNGLKLTTSYAYDGLGNTVRVARGTVASPQLEVTDYVYDRLGRRVKEIAAPSSVFGNGTATTRNLTTEYRYDASGRLSRKIDANGKSTWYIYDAAGQLTYTVNASGEVTGNVYDQNGRVVQTRRYINRANVTNYGDAPTSPGAPQNFQDERTYLIYDVDGRQRFTLQAVSGLNWTIAENRFDEQGNIIETRAYEKYLPDARVVADDSTQSPGISLSELSAELTTLGYDDANPSTLAGVRRTHFVYDAGNRLRYTIDATGGVSENAYDAVGNVIETVRYAFRPTLSEYTLAELEFQMDVRVGAQATEFVYDKASRLRYTLRQVLDQSGVTTGYVVAEQEYDALGRVVQSTSYAQVLTSSISSSESAVANAVKALPANPQNRRSAFVYDAAGRQIYNVQVLRVDASGQTLHRITQNTYDALGHLTKTTAYAPQTGLADYTKATLDTTVAGSAFTDNASNRTTRFAYDAAGRLRFTVAADRSFNEIVYDALGQVTERRQFAIAVPAATAMTEEALIALRAERNVGDGVTRGEKYAYDSVGRLSSTTYASSTASVTVSESNLYDALGHRTSHTDANGSTWTYKYDYLGRLTEEISPVVAVQTKDNGSPVSTPVSTRISYDALGNISQRIEAAGTSDSRTTTYGYDLVGRQTSVTHPAVSIQLSNETKPSNRSLQTTMEYDALGNLKKRTEASGTVDARCTAYEYDSSGRQVLTTLPGFYNAATGKVTKDQVAGSFARTLATTYDVFGNVIRTALRTGAGANDVQYEYKTYDAMGRLVHDIDALNHVTGFLYDAFGEQTSISRYNGGIGTPTGADGLWTVAAVASKLTNAARTIAISYDTMGRKTEVETENGGHYLTYSIEEGIFEYTSGAKTRYTYDIFGQLFKESVPGETGFRDTYHYYDVMGRESLSVDALGYQTSRKYDAVGNLKELVQYANAGTTTPASTPPALPTLSDNDRITVFNYDALNRQISVQRKGLSYMSLQSNGSYLEVNNGRDVATTVSTTTYDGMGRVRAQTDALGNKTVTDYNLLGQVIKVTEPGRQVAKAGVADPFLDANKITVWPMTTFALNAFGQVVTQIRSPGAGVGATLVTLQSYDHAGNLIASTDANHASLDTKGTSNTSDDVIVVDHTFDKLRQYDVAGRVIRETQTVLLTAGDLEVKQPAPPWISGFTQTLERRYAYDALGRQTDVLDVYKNDAGVLQQSGVRNVYNEFGEVKEELRVWGAASTSSIALFYARLATNTYDDAGLLVSRQAADGVTNYFYNHAGQVTLTEQTGNGSTADETRTRRTYTRYDALGRATLQQLPGYFDDGVGVQGGVISPLVEQTYDRWGNVLSRSEGGYLFTSEYEDGGVLNDLRLTTTYEYNDDNKVLAVHLPAALAYTNSTTSTQSLVNRTHGTRYDLLGREVLELESAQWGGAPTTLRTRTSTYNGAGQLESATDGTNRTTRYAYDAHGNRIATLGASGTVLVDKYDNNGNLTSHGVLRTGTSDYKSGVTPAASAVFVTLNRYKYDQANRRVLQVDLTNNASAKAYATLSRFDERNLLTHTYQAAIYAPPGELIEGALLTKSTTYDQLGNRLTETDAIGGVVSWQYESADYVVGRLQKRSLAGLATDFSYNDFGQLKQELTSNGFERNFQYHDNGWLKIAQVITKGGNVNSGNGYVRTQTTGYDYNARGQLIDEGSLSSIVLQKNGGSTYQEYSRGTQTTYDAAGRVSNINVTGAKELMKNVSYGYDMLGNRASVTASYVGAGNSIELSINYYEFDQEGRALIVDSNVRGNAGYTGTALTYDAAGRRSTATHRDSWGYTVVDTYGYNDLGYLDLVLESDGGKFLGEQYVKETRHYDDSGRLASNYQYSMQEQDVYVYVPLLLRKTLNEYLGVGGLLSSSDITSYGNEAIETLVNYTRDDAGNIKKHTNSLYREVSENVWEHLETQTYTYTYQSTIAGWKEKTIAEVTVPDGGSPQNGSTTENQYDALGNLVIQTANGKVTWLSYDIDGHVRTKWQNTDDYQNFYFSDGKQIGVVGRGKMEIAEFANAFSPISESYPGATPQTYVVAATDTLGKIAEAVFGDASLWYLIADANNLNFGPDAGLPSTEIGKTYRIPNVVINVTGKGGAFKPYNVADVIGSGVPEPAHLPGPTCWQQTAPFLELALVVAVTAVVSAFTGGLAAAAVGPVLGAAVGGAAGSVAGQATGWGLGMNEGVSGWQVLSDSATAGLGAGIAANVAVEAQKVGALARAFGGVAQVFSGMAVDAVVNNRFDAASLVGIPVQALAGALLGNGAVASGVAKAASSALNPNTGWVFHQELRGWQSIASQAISQTSDLLGSNLGSVGAGGLLNAFTSRPGFDIRDIPPAVREDGSERPDAYRPSLQAEAQATLGASLDDLAATELGVAGSFSDSSSGGGAVLTEGLDITAAATLSGDPDVGGVPAPPGVDEGSYLGQRVVGDTVIHRWRTGNGTVEATYNGSGLANRETNVPISNYRYTMADEVAPYAEINPRSGAVSYINNSLEVDYSDAIVMQGETPPDRSYSEHYQNFIELNLAEGPLAEIDRRNAEYARQPTFDGPLLGRIKRAQEEARRAGYDVPADYKSWVRPEEYGEVENILEMNERLGSIRAPGDSQPISKRLQAEIAQIQLARDIVSTGHRIENMKQQGASALLFRIVAAALGGNAEFQDQAAALGAVADAAMLVAGARGYEMGPGSQRPEILNAPGTGNVARAPRPSALASIVPSLQSIGSGGSSGYYPTRASVVNALRLSGSWHARGMADAIEKDVVDFTILPTNPNPATKRYTASYSDNEIVLHADMIKTPLEAASAAAHEGVHWLQEMNGRLANYHVGHEYEAVMTQRLVDPSHWANKLSDAGVMSLLIKTYQGIAPPPPPGWRPMTY